MTWGTHCSMCGSTECSWVYGEICEGRHLQLVKENTRLREALSFYADVDNYRTFKLRPSGYGKDSRQVINTGPHSVDEDFGRIARAALGEEKL